MILRFKALRSRLWEGFRLVEPFVALVFGIAAATSDRPVAALLWGIISGPWLSRWTKLVGRRLREHRARKQAAAGAAT